MLILLQINGFQSVGQILKLVSKNSRLIMISTLGLFNLFIMKHGSNNNMQEQRLTIFKQGRVDRIKDVNFSRQLLSITLQIVA